MCKFTHTHIHTQIRYSWTTLNKALLTVQKTALQILVHDPVNQQFEQLGNRWQYRNMSLSPTLLKMWVTIDSFDLTEQIHVAKDLLKSMHRSNANPEAPFFKISGGTPSGPGPLLLSNSNNAFSTSETVNSKGCSSFTRSSPGLNGAHESSKNVRSLNSTTKSQIICNRKP
jgi:hypothetical protein